MPSLWWIRRDLRLSDNQSLRAALEASAGEWQSHSQVIPVFILDPKLLDSPYSSEKRKYFLFDGLRSLDADLRRRGSYLVVRSGDPRVELARLAEESQAQTIFSEADISPYARRRDSGINLPVQWVGSPAILPPGMVLKPDGEPYTVFTPFSKAWKARVLGVMSDVKPYPAPDTIETPAGLDGLPIPEAPADTLPSRLFPAGEAEAQRRLAAFTQSQEGNQPLVDAYSAGRDRQDLEGTSRLSPYLRFGMLSPRQALAAALRALLAAADMAGDEAQIQPNGIGARPGATPSSERRMKGAETWLNELIWREFYIHILYHFPKVRRQNFRPMEVRWENNPDHFQAWCEGRTGYPVVDAAMHQLVESGWMHNRARMVTASFLTKDLLVDWRWGERFFMQHLLDGDPAANNGGWQWTAGTGTDAAPYFRIFNPVLQSLRHDPHGDYIRRWLPELKDVPTAYIHEPWLMPPEVQRQAGCVIGVDYPAPIIEHGPARERALRAYRPG